ncbi:NTP transferase domain-containing protein [Candidatus Kaiserbacteria bacterium]|nr:NTP transferase domain-containing protein [Candidatus Kaiserbacteria bacterium]
MHIRKAVILAGGSGTRLHPVTRATNKHLLPIYDQPAIFHAIDKLVDAGITRIMIVTGPDHLDDFAHVLGSGQHWKPKYGKEKQIQITYGIQNKPNGIAQGLFIAKEYVNEEPCVLYLGDNYIEDDLEPYIKNFKDGATVFLTRVKDPERFGIATIGKDGTVLSIEEKPKKPKTDLAVAGIYLYDETVFAKMADQKPSVRGEYEITYVNNKYIKERKLRAVMLKKEWFDVGTFDSLLEVSQHVKNKRGKTKR